MYTNELFEKMLMTLIINMIPIQNFMIHFLMYEIMICVTGLRYACRAETLSNFINIS
ncbi:MAG: hypothetical protein V8R67_14525 [Eubacterium sp.]